MYSREYSAMAVSTRASQMWGRGPALSMEATGFFSSSIIGDERKEGVGGSDAEGRTGVANSGTEGAGTAAGKEVKGVGAGVEGAEDVGATTDMEDTLDSSSSTYRFNQSISID